MKIMHPALLEAFGSYTWFELFLLIWLLVGVAAWLVLSICHSVAYRNTSGHSGNFLAGLVICCTAWPFLLVMLLQTLSLRLLTPDSRSPTPDS